MPLWGSFFSGGTPPTLALDLRARNDVVGTVGPAHPRLMATVVVRTPEDQRRRLAQGRARLAALTVQATPDAHERVVLELVGDRAGVRVAGSQDGLAREREDHVQDRVLDVLEARRAGRADAAHGALEERVAGEELTVHQEVEHPR